MPARPSIVPRAVWALGLLAPVVLVACADDDSAGGGSYSDSTPKTTDPQTTATTDVTPTTTATDTNTATDTDSDGTTDGTATETTPTTLTTGEPSELLVECGAPPGGAVGAEYAHTPTASGGVPGYKWSATGLPEGLTINANTGEISGVPTTAGDFTIALTVTDVGGAVAMTSCPLIAIAEEFTVDPDALYADGPCISDPQKSILDYVEGGDGSPIKCTTPGGTGDGKLPAGITVDPDTCKITGAIAETRYGTWAWIVRAEQAGVRVYAPYCATQSQQAAKAYKIVGNHSGGMDNELVPLLMSFDPDAALELDGDADPAFEVTKALCGDACFFGFTYKVSTSPLGGGACKEDKDGCFGLCPLVPDGAEPDGDKQVQCSLLPKAGSPKIGFAHEMWAKGDVPADGYKDRPFIVQWSIDYCLSSAQPDCQGKDNILANGDGSNLEFPVIWRPQ